MAKRSFSISSVAMAVLAIVAGILVIFAFSIARWISAFSLLCGAFWRFSNEDKGSYLRSKSFRKSNLALWRIFNIGAYVYVNYYTVG